VNGMLAISGFVAQWAAAPLCDRADAVSPHG
jgi:hypothetical protein